MPKMLAQHSTMPSHSSVISSATRYRVSPACPGHRHLPPLVLDNNIDRLIVSDLIALGTVMAVAACGGPHIEMKGGRIDATAAGPSGVPEPETDISDTLTDFSNAGFVTDDAITLTACGHTMGGVHHSTFPQAVPASAVSSTNTDGRIVFDETVAVFDIDTVNDYVHGTGDKGGPLVTTTNKTVNSDYRIYNSDNNGTITRLSQSASYFEGQCADIFQRMIETIPGGVSLTTAVDPTSTTNLRPYDISLNVNWQGSMTLTGYFRVRTFHAQKYKFPDANLNSTFKSPEPPLPRVPCRKFYHALFIPFQIASEADRFKASPSSTAPGQQPKRPSRPQYHPRTPETAYGGPPIPTPSPSPSKPASASQASKSPAKISPSKTPCSRSQPSRLSLPPLQLSPQVPLSTPSRRIRSTRLSLTSQVLLQHR